MIIHYQQYCLDRQRTGRYRILPTDQKIIPLNFSSNDYFGLSHSPLLYDAALKAAKTYGVGATGSRLLSGSNPLFTQLENDIAKAKGCESALMMGSGFQANSSVLASLLDSKVLNAKPIVFFDKLNHASLYQAAFLSQAELIRYHHNDMMHLNDLLNKYKKDTRPKFIVAETLFGMDGDLLPIEDIVNLARRHQALLYLDEAHATGIVGNHGYGLASTILLTDIPHVIMGTFSKALGCFGAYIAGPASIKDYLINHCPGFIYATALSPMLVGAAKAAWGLMPSLYEERNKLLANAEWFRTQLYENGWDIGTSSTHIIPIILGDEKEVARANHLLLEANIVVSIIRPPTVPPNTCRLRIALNTQHTQQDLIRLLDTIKKL